MEEEDYREKSLRIEKTTKIRCEKLMEKFGDQIIEYRGSGGLHGIFLKTEKTFLTTLLKLLPLEMNKDTNFLSKLIVASLADWMYHHKKIYALFSNADEIAFMFTPSLIMEDNEINYFFDSIEDAFNIGIRKIITEFITKQFSKTIHG